MPYKVLEVHGPWQEAWFDLYESRDCDGIDGGGRPGPRRPTCLRCLSFHA